MRWMNFNEPARRQFKQEERKRAEEARMARHFAALRNQATVQLAALRKGGAA